MTVDQFLQWQERADRNYEYPARERERKFNEDAPVTEVFHKAVKAVAKEEGEGR